MTHCVNSALTVPDESKLQFDPTVNDGKTLLNRPLTLNCAETGAKLESDESKSSVDILCNAQGQFEPPLSWPVCATETSCPDPAAKSNAAFTISGTGYTAGNPVMNGHIAK